MEAVSLPSLGMPQDAFTLILDGNPRPDLASEMFAVAQQDASWQAVSEESDAAMMSRYESRRNLSYIMEGFLSAMRDIVDGTSLVRCNFRPLPNYETDGLPNPEIDQLPHANPQWTLSGWETN
jgi:hypothetical protein